MQKMLIYSVEMSLSVLGLAGICHGMLVLRSNLLHDSSVLQGSVTGCYSWEGISHGMCVLQESVTEY